MTRQKDLKARIRTRQEITGENYMTARAKVIEEQPLPHLDGGRDFLQDERGDVDYRCNKGSGIDSDSDSGLDADSDRETSEYPATADELTGLIVSRKDNAMRLRLLGSGDLVTFRTSQYYTWSAIPAQLVRFRLKKRWTWKGHSYASGEVQKRWTDLKAAGIKPLALNSQGMASSRSFPPFPKSEPHYRLWKEAISVPREEFEFDPIAWGIVKPEEPDAPENSWKFDAAETRDRQHAEELLMRVLDVDVRCVDAHVHLGNLVFERRPEAAIEYYKMAVAIAELSFPKGFDGFLRWICLNNRPYLRALHGLGLCQWRLEKRVEAKATFERIMRFNPNDNQGVRYCWDAIQKGESWKADS